MKAVYVIVVILNANFRHVLRLGIQHLLLSSLFLQQWDTWKVGKDWVPNSLFTGYKILQSISAHSWERTKTMITCLESQWGGTGRKQECSGEYKVIVEMRNPKEEMGRGQWCWETGRCSHWEQEAKWWLDFRAHHRMPRSQSGRSRQDSPSFLLTQNVASWEEWELASKHHIPVRTQPQKAALTAPSKGEEDTCVVIILYSLERTVYL